MAIFRDVFLTLSTNWLIQGFVVRFPLSRRASRRFVAGESLDEAIRVINKLNQQNLQVTLDYLGENVTTESEAQTAKDEYLLALDAIAKNQVKSHISVKLTQMGLDLNPNLCLNNMRQIVSRAKMIGTFVQIDMEDSKHTQATLDIFKTLKKEFDNVGIAIQSYLYRSEDDIRNLLTMGANVRLCKGAYKEPANIAFPKKRDVDANFIKLTQIYLSPNTNRPYLAIATHDEKIINWTKEYVALNSIERDHFEFQMLYGIRKDLQRRLADEGFVVRVYVPYGTHWYPYFMRRLAERPANVFFLISNLFRK